MTEGHLEEQRSIVSAGGAMIDVLDGGQMAQARSWRAAQKPGAAPSAGRPKEAASMRDSNVPVSSHAKPRPIRVTSSVPARRYCMLRSVISNSPRLDGLISLA